MQININLKDIRVTINKFFHARNLFYRLNKRINSIINDIYYITYIYGEKHHLDYNQRKNRFEQEKAKNKKLNEYYYRKIIISDEYDKLETEIKTYCKLLNIPVDYKYTELQRFLANNFE